MPVFERLNEIRRFRMEIFFVALWLFSFVYLFGAIFHHFFAIFFFNFSTLQRHLHNRKLDHLAMLAEIMRMLLKSHISLIRMKNAHVWRTAFYLLYLLYGTLLFRIFSANKNVHCFVWFMKIISAHGIHCVIWMICCGFRMNIVWENFL